jgi:hypothetical protein
MNDNKFRNPNDGRFIAGNKFAKGYPLAPKLYAIKEAMVATCSVEVVKRATERLIELCHDEDKKIAIDALHMLFDRLLGKPKAQIELEVQQQTDELNLKALSNEDLKTVVAILDKATP